MKTRQAILGTVIMAFLVIHSATGQTAHPQPGSSPDRNAACELIEASLQRSVQEKDTAAQIADLQKTSNQVLKLCTTNLAVTQVLKKAMSKAADVSDKQQAGTEQQNSAIFVQGRSAICMKRRRLERSARTLAQLSTRGRARSERKPRVMA